MKTKVLDEVGLQTSFEIGFYVFKGKNIKMVYGKVNKFFGLRREEIRRNRDEVILVPKKVHCRDLGFDCDGIVEGETEEEVLTKVAAHAKEAHNMTEISADVRDKVLSVMK